MAAEGMQSHDQSCGNCPTASHPASKKGRINAPILPKPARCAKSDRLIAAGLYPIGRKTEFAPGVAHPRGGDGRALLLGADPTAFHRPLFCGEQLAPPRWRVAP